MSEKGTNAKQGTEAKELKLTEPSPYAELTVLQRRYVEARCQGLAPRAAAAAAGMAEPKNALPVMERHPKVRKAIAWVVNESFGDVSDITKNDVLRGMKDAVESAATSQDLVSAWREIGKLIGAYEPERKILEVHDYTKEELKSLDEAELVRLAGSKMSSAIDGEFYEVGKDGNLEESS